MGKGAADTSCRQAMTLDAAAAPKRVVLPDGITLLPVEHLAAMGTPRSMTDNPPPFTAEQFFAVHDFQHQGLRVEFFDSYLVQPAEGTPAFSTRSMFDEYKYDGRIVNAEGEQVGVIGRELRRDDAGRLWVELTRLYLHTDHQGKGFGPAFHRHCEQQYRRLGVHGLEATAVEMGAYTWAGAGFHFDPQRVTRHHRILSGHVDRDDPRWEDPHFACTVYAAQLWAENEPRMEQLTWDGQLTRRQFQALRRRFASGKQLASETGWKRKVCTPGQLRELGRDMPFTDADGEKSWPGRYLLFGLRSHRKAEYAFYHDRDNTQDRWPPPKAASWTGVKFLAD